MAKKKNSMALFEVISKHRDKNPDAEVLVPGWVKPGHKEQKEQTPDPQEAPPQETDSVEPVAPPTEVEPVAAVEAPTTVEQAEPQEAPPQPPQPQPLIPEPLDAGPVESEPEQPVEPEPEQPAEAPEVVDVQAKTPEPKPQTTGTVSSSTGRATPTRKNPNMPIWNTEGGRLTVSLNYVSCMVAAMGVLLLIIGAFALGRMTASPEPPPAAPTKPKPISRVHGKWYIVIERFTGNGPAVEKEAKRIAAFCNANKAPATVQPVPVKVNGRIVRGRWNLIVWSAKPFDTPNSEAARAYALDIQNNLGVKYSRKYGSRYSFRQPRVNGAIVPTMYRYIKKR